jgi:hypothetical protein
MAALVGSANFTASAMTANVEACLLLGGPADHPAMRELMEFFAGCWRAARPIDEEFVREYELNYRATKSERDRLRRKAAIRKPTNEAPHPYLLSMSWEDYAAEVKRRQSYELRIRQLQAAREIFRRASPLTKAPVDEWRCIAGTWSRRKERRDGVNWGYFGSMLGFGVLKNLVNRRDQNLSLALEDIPLTGKVTRDDYVSFEKRFLHAFSVSARKGRLAPASRLSAMKRPDYFVCIDSENTYLCSDLGLPKTAPNLDNY